MKSLIGRALRIKSGILTSLLGLLVPFLIFLGDYLNVLYIVFKKNTSVPVLSIAFHLAGIIAGAFFLAILLGRIKRSEGEENLSSPSTGMNPNHTPDSPVRKKSGSKIPFAAAIMNILLSVILLELVKFLLSPITSTQPAVRIIITLLPIVTFVFLNVIFITAGWFNADNPAGIGNYPGAILLSFQKCFKRPTYLAIMLLLWITAITAAIFIYLWLWKLLSGSFMSALLSAFYPGAMISCVFGSALTFSLKLAKVAFQEAAESAETDAAFSGEYKGAPAKKGNAAFGLVLSLLLISAAIYCIIPRTGNVLDQINSDIGKYVERAEQYRDQENLYLCGIEYKKAFALTQALQAFVYNQELVLDKNLSDEKKNEVIDLSNQSMASAYEFYPNSSEILYLDAMRSKGQGNISDAILKLEAANKIKPVFNETNSALLDLYLINQEKLKTTEIIDTLIETGDLEKSGAIDKTNSSTSKKLLEEYAVNSKTYIENITAIAMDYYENQLYPEAMNVLTLIQKYSPDALEVNYLIAMTDLEIKSDNKRYDAAIDACRKILAQYPDETWAKDLLTGVTIRAGNQEAMDQTIQTAYQQNPDNPDTAEQYAYSLLRKNSSFDFVETDKTAESVISSVLDKDVERWFSHYCKALIELKKRNFEASVTDFEKFSDLIEGDETLFTQYDELYNQYILKYAYMMKYYPPGPVDFIKTKETTNPFLYQYACGAYYWSIKDFENGKKSMDAAVSLRPDLSKPWFLLGDIYFEEGYRKKNNDHYLSAESNYRRALSIFQEDPFAWFSLGHVLKNMNRYEEALGAFRKTLSYMPAEDHSSDHFGISVHAAAQVQELSAILEKKGEK